MQLLMAIAGMRAPQLSQRHKAPSWVRPVALSSIRPPSPTGSREDSLPNPRGDAGEVEEYVPLQGEDMDVEVSQGAY